MALKGEVQRDAEDDEAADPSLFHLRYSLSRLDRLVPHLKLWGAMGPLLTLAFGNSLLGTLFDFRWVWMVLAVIFWICGRNYLKGFFNVLVRPTQQMDLLIRANAVGFLAGGERWWVFMDGVVSIRTLRKGVWTIQHHNGVVIHVPFDQMPDGLIDYVRAWRAWGLEVLKAHAAGRREDTPEPEVPPRPEWPMAGGQNADPLGWSGKSAIGRGRLRP